MAREFDRFVAAPIGTGLAVADSGLTLTTTLPSLDIQRTARGAIAHSTGQHGVEFAFWGDAALAAAIGLVQSSSPLTSAVGQASNSVGWRLDTGEVLLDGTVVATGLTIPTKQQIVGVVFDEQPGGNYVAEFYLGTTMVHSQALSAGASWYFAVSLQAAAAATLFVAVNAGQWPALSPAAQTGWQPAVTYPLTVSIADAHYLSTPTDYPPNHRYEGVIADAGIETIAEVGFWPWSTPTSPRSGAAQFTVRDTSGILDAVDVDTTVSLRLVDAHGSLADGVLLGRYVVDAIDPESDGRWRVRLRDAHDDLDEPVNPGVFLPNIPQLAWKPQPLVLGACASVPYLPANGDGTVGFLADAPLSEVSVVLDRGDALEAGQWSMYGGNQVLLLSPPLGPTVCDVSSIGAGMAPGTLQQMLHQIYSRIRKWSWSSADAAAIDTATGYAGIGFFSESSVSARSATDAMLASYGAAYWKAPDGNLRFVRLIDPDTATAALTLDAASLGEDLLRVPDLAPNLTRRMGYRPNGAPMSAGDFVTDLVDVPVQRRQELMGLYRGLVYSAKPLASRYVAADRRDAMISFFWRQEDAQAEIDRICGLYAVDRYFYRWNIVGQPALTVLPGQVVRVVYPGHGFETGRNLFVAGVQQNRSTGRLSLRLWGA